jgi:hypothetical protein
MTRLNLTAEEREGLLHVIDAAVRDSRHPLAPEPEGLKRVAEKPRGEEKPKTQRR